MLFSSEEVEARFWTELEGLLDRYRTAGELTFPDDDNGTRDAILDGMNPDAFRMCSGAVLCWEETDDDGWSFAFHLGRPRQPASTTAGLLTMAAARVVHG